MQKSAIVDKITVRQISGDGEEIQLKYDKIYHSKKQQLRIKERQLLMEKIRTKEEEKNGFLIHFRFAFVSNKSSGHLNSKQGHWNGEK